MKASLMCVFLSVFMFTFDWYKLKNRLPFIRCNVANEHPYHIPPIGNTHTHTHKSRQEKAPSETISKSEMKMEIAIFCSYNVHPYNMRSLFLSHTLSLSPTRSHTRIRISIESSEISISFSKPKIKNSFQTRSKNVERRNTPTPAAQHMEWAVARPCVNCEWEKRDRVGGSPTNNFNNPWNHSLIDRILLGICVFVRLSSCHENQSVLPGGPRLDSMPVWGR